LFFPVILEATSPDEFGISLYLTLPEDERGFVFSGEIID
jgi:hypothetical protein